MQPLEISTIPIVGFSLILGRPTLETSISSRATTLFPFKVELITSSVFPKEFGPSRLASCVIFSTVVLSAFGKQPATTSGFDFRLLMRWIILLAVTSFTEHVTTRFKSDSDELSASV